MTEPVSRNGDAAAAASVAGRRVFDDRQPPSAELISDCVHCGFCLATCPTYVLWGEEMDSPRGRIYLMDLGLKDEVEMTPTYVGHFDKCLGCMACVTACPSGVQYEKLIEATRFQVERRHRRPVFERLFRRLMFATFPYPYRLRLLALPLWFSQASGLQRLARAAGLTRRLPTRLRVLEALSPPVTRQSFRSSFSIPRRVGGRSRMRVGMLLGCVQRVFFPGVNEATARVLAAEGCDVVVPADQGCCGALMVHAGQEADAVTLARRMIDAFDREDVDRIAINAAGCGSSMKEVGHLLRDDPAYAEKARSFAAKCRDVTEILAELGEPTAKRHPVPLRVAYQDACHLRHAQAVAEAPRRLLSAIPALELLEIDEPDICCGSAGVYNLLEPQAAGELGERKARNILATGAEAVVTGNPGCLLQIRSSLDRLGEPLPVLHTVEFIDASIRGQIPDRMSETRRSGRD